MIKHNEKNNIFILETKNTHYVFGVDEEGYNRHIHWGNKCNYGDYEFVHVNGENSNNTVQDEIRQEITPFGSTMYRECDIKAEFSDGCREISMHYDSFVLEKNILKVIFKDDYYPLQIILNYEVYDEYDIIKRYITLKNTGNDNIVFERIFSAEFSLPSVKPYTFINTNGAWGSEFLQTNTVLDGGSIIYENRRGASNHNNSPYFIAHQNADENSGDVYFASLAYSGNFKISASRDVYSITRISIGMNDFDFSHTLKPGETFDSPLVYCGRANGFGEMSRNMNRFSIDFLLPKSFNDKPLPVYGTGENVRDWLYVEDHCRAIDLIIHNGRVGEVYNVGGHNEMTNIDIVKIICKELGKPESLITYVADRKGHDMRYAIDPTKIHNELGWLPETKFADGIKKTIKWYLDNKEWWETIISGEYQNYYEKMYGNRK